MCYSGPSSVAASLRSTTVSGCQDFVFPRIWRLLYVRLAGLLYSMRVGPNHIRLVSGDALASTARAIPVWNAIHQHLSALTVLYR